MVQSNYGNQTSMDTGHGQLQVTRHPARLDSRCSEGYDLSNGNILMKDANLSRMNKVGNPDFESS